MVKNIFSSLVARKYLVLVIAVFVFLFYWYEARPILVARKCVIESSNDARSLLRSKAALSTDQNMVSTYNQLIAKNMYMRADYESFLQKCLLYHGIQLMPLREVSMTTSSPGSIENLPDPPAKKANKRSY